MLSHRVAATDVPSTAAAERPPRTERPRPWAPSISTRPGRGKTKQSRGRVGLCYWRRLRRGAASGVSATRSSRSLGGAGGAAPRGPCWPRGAVRVCWWLVARRRALARPARAKCWPCRPACGTHSGRHARLHRAPSHPPPVALAPAPSQCFCRSLFLAFFPAFFPFIACPRALPFFPLRSLCGVSRLPSFLSLFPLLLRGSWARGSHSPLRVGTPVLTGEPGRW